MNTTLLIDAIVRQTTVLIASLATASGQRAPLAHLANVLRAIVRKSALLPPTDGQGWR